MAESAHSKYSASGFEAGRLCAGKSVMEAGRPNNSSEHSREGTAAHWVLEQSIIARTVADQFKGHRVPVEDTHTVEVDSDMVENINWCLDQIKAYADDDGVVLAESRVYYADAIGVAREEGWGTADVIIMRGKEIIVMDLKYGRGVEVDADCDQLKLYALGALAEHDGIVEDFEHCRMVILQPRISRAPKEHDMPVGELRQWAATVAWEAVEKREAARTAGGRVEFQQYLSPGEKQCKFCKAKATCPALREEVTSAVFMALPATPEEFDDMTVSTPAEQAEMPDGNPADFLANALSKVDLIEDWCKAVRAEAERRLQAGQPVPGYKLVQGKRGNRAWSDPKAAEEMLKTFRLKQEDMYEFKLISPTTAEKLAKAETIGKRQWPKLQALITQSEGKPHVAPASDPRPALEVKPVEDEFDDVSTSTVDDLA